jgi:hypothetical protein
MWFATLAELEEYCLLYYTGLLLWKIAEEEEEDKLYGCPRSRWCQWRRCCRSRQ